MTIEAGLRTAVFSGYIVKLYEDTWWQMAVSDGSMDCAIMQMKTREI